MKLLKSLLCVSLLAVAANAFAGATETKFYAAARGGYALQRIDGTTYDGPSVHGALGLAMPIGNIGYDLDKTIYLRTEIESGWGKVSKSGSDSSVVPIGLNVLVDIPITAKLYAFAGVGVGYEFVDVSTGSQSATDDVWYGQVRGGLGYWIAETVALEIGYCGRVNDFRWSQESLTHMAEAGIVLRF